MSATQTQTVQAPTASSKGDRRASAIAATKLSGVRSTEVFNLATHPRCVSQTNRGSLPNEATLTTDQEDYQPYTYVYITGMDSRPAKPST